MPPAAVSSSNASFSARGRAVLELFRGHVARALGGLRARRHSAALIDAFERGVDAAGAGLALVGRGGKVKHRSAEATRLLGERLPEPVVTALAAGLEPPALAEHAGHRLRLELVRGEIDVLVVRELPSPAADHGLTLRELAVLEYVRDGLSDAETAAALGISPRTVHHVYAKLGVANRTAAVARVFRDVHGER